MINKVKKIIINLKKIINIKKLKEKNNELIIKLKKEDKKKYIILNKKISKYNKIINIYNNIISLYKDIQLLYKFSLKENFTTTTINFDIIIYYNKIRNLFKNFKYQIFNRLDRNNAILQISAGAGGLDSSNWVKILYNMYKLWSIKNNFKINTINKICINKNCIKNIIVEIIGKYAYGYLKGENGIHKLIRISPFNKKRHTSFASVNVDPLIKNENNININLKEIIYQTFRSSGAGGQNVDKVESGVRLIHKPTNLSIVCTKTRSQKLNKEYALKLLKYKLEMLKTQNKNTPTKDKIEWGNHNRIYIMHPYKMIKDVKTGYKTYDLDKFINGKIDDIINEYIKTYIYT
ncbi:MAG: PCRF domain-containing protein [Candidatus Shikimatogenerans sp. JK-2022]|nr:PCRF domain-containing protein [Candidatus Shikimatogenerans bostrichidophilus]